MVVTADFGMFISGNSVYRHIRTLSGRTHSQGQNDCNSTSYGSLPVFETEPEWTNFQLGVLELRKHYKLYGSEFNILLGGSTSLDINVILNFGQYITDNTGEY